MIRGIQKIVHKRRGEPGQMIEEAGFSALIFGICESLVHERKIGFNIPEKSIRFNTRRDQ